jgi:steroid delta-isomerase
MTEQNLATVRSFWNSINNRDVEGYLGTFTEDGIAYDPVNGPPLRTSAERRAFMEGLLASFSTLQANIDFATPCGDHSAAKWTVDATTTAGDPVRIEGIDVYRHAPDGRIEEMWGYFQM